MFIQPFKFKPSKKYVYFSKKEWIKIQENIFPDKLYKNNSNLILDNRIDLISVIVLLELRKILL